MKRKKQKQVAAVSFADKFNAMPVNKKRRLLLSSAVGVVGLGAGAVALSAHEKEQKTLHDLSVIGQGSPVVVQVHDPSCPTCRRLKGRTMKALEAHPDVLYRLADITTSDGRLFQKKYPAEKITLLLFNEKGRHVQTSQGLATPEALEELFAAEFGVKEA